jgi:NAD(P)-dependent dehydrogenase (short-subunit alcohol dehydrogenase family)
MPNSYDHAGKTAIVTGGAGGIGTAITKRLAASGSPNEVAHLVAWLCSDGSRFNTGAVFDMSGGRARY